jgi:hypothetical protein
MKVQFTGCNEIMRLLHAATGASEAAAELFGCSTQNLAVLAAGTVKKNFTMQPCLCFTFYQKKKKGVNKSCIFSEDLLPLRYSNGRLCANQSSLNGLFFCQQTECYTIKHKYSYWRFQMLVVKERKYVQFKRDLER